MRTTTDDAFVNEVIKHRVHIAGMHVLDAMLRRMFHLDPTLTFHLDPFPWFSFFDVGQDEQGVPPLQKDERGREGVLSRSVWAADIALRC